MSLSYIISVGRIGFERGLQKGEKVVLQRQLVGKLSESISSAVAAINSEAVESLTILILRGYAIALLNFSSIEDLEAWLAQH